MEERAEVLQQLDGSSYQVQSFLVFQQCAHIPTWNATFTCCMLEALVVESIRCEALLAVCVRGVPWS